VPIVVGRQRPTEQLEPSPHTEHVLPSEPHASEVCPDLHWPMASQQPMEQFVGSHFDDAVPHDGTNATTRPAATPTTRARSDCMRALYHGVDHFKRAGSELSFAR
jgi:hypothetical protein